MSYRVRNADGEVRFRSLYEVERALAAGLVEPDDEIREDGQERWRKVGSLPALQDVETGRQKDRLSWLLVLSAVVFGGAALFMMARGNWLAALLLALLVWGMASRLQVRATRPRR